MTTDARATLKVTPHESVTIRRSDPDLLEMLVSYGPGAEPPPAHLHPAQDEAFEVLEGEIRARVDGRELTLRAGDTLEIRRGATHQMWNGGAGQARAVWQVRPRLRTDQWFQAIDALHREGRVGPDGMPGPLAWGVLLTEYRDVFRLAARPEPVIRAALAVLAVTGRLRGYRAKG